MIRSATHSSYPRVGEGPWDRQLWRAARDREAGRAADDDVRRVEDEVAALVVAEQSRAFVDVVTDGLVRWTGPLSHVAARLDGVSLDGLVRWFGTALYDRRPVVTGPVARGGPITVRDAELALDVRPPALKAVLPGPATLARFARDRHYGDARALASAFAAALAEEAADLVSAGVRIVQLDEPVLCGLPEDATLVADAARVVFEGAAGAEATVLSTYFGDLAGLGAAAAAALPGTHLGLDMVHGPGNWPLLAALPADKGVHLGLFDATTTRLEAAAEVAARLLPYREALMARDVMVGPQCGLEGLPRDTAFDKLLQARYLKERLEREWRWRS